MTGMKTRQQLIEEVEILLCQHLHQESFSGAVPKPENGNLGIDILYVRVEPWTHGTETVSLKGAWELCVASAELWGRVPVLAHQWYGEWSFRGPFYLAEIGIELEPDKHQWVNSFEMSPRALAQLLKFYQEDQTRRQLVDYLAESEA